MEARLMFVHAITPLHAGTGQGVGLVDLPIAREVSTGLPFVPGSSLKGVLRDLCDEKHIDNVFGPKATEIDADNLKAGAAQFTDQRLLLLPVRSLAGVFAWVTSPFVLQRFQRECQHLPNLTPPTSIPTIEKNKAYVTDSKEQPSTLTVQVNKAPTVVLEDLDLVAEGSTAVHDWANWLGKQLFPEDEQWQTLLEKKLCIVHDDILGFLLQTATEIIARNVLNDDKTADNLWYEEALPSESILSGLILAQKIGANGMAPTETLDVVQGLTSGLVQLGGHATVGRGLCRLYMKGGQ